MPLGVSPRDFTYTAQRDEASMGLMDYRARYYDPALNRFIQADTIVPDAESSQALNRYMYTLGNPLRYTDPTGNYSEEEIMEAFGVDNWDDVLAYFLKGSGTLLEGRWGWLEILRKASDGDIVIGNPWESVADNYQEFVFGISRDESGRFILSNGLEHDLFANQQISYGLIAFKDNHLETWETPFDKVHRHLRPEIFKYSWADAGAVFWGVLGIGFELADPEPVTSALGQALLDGVGHYGAGQSFMRWIEPKRYGYPTSEDALSIASMVPGLYGITAGVVDTGGHALGFRIRFGP